jgi:uncharacterized protein (DUF305 family)
MQRIKRAGVVATLSLAAGLVLAGCGKDDSGHGSMPGMGQSTANPSGAVTMSAPVDHNDSDVEFASTMIPHHRQAVEMADLALKKASNGSVLQLATAIKGAQDPEIKEMSGWLTGWGKPVPSTGMGHSMGSGMMTEQEMAELDTASGSVFDRLWVQLMIKHHQGAVAMAKTEQTAGESPKAIELAKKIETAQNAEIAAMQKLLGQIP